MPAVTPEERSSAEYQSMIEADTICTSSGRDKGKAKAEVAKLLAKFSQDPEAFYRDIKYLADIVYQRNKEHFCRQDGGKFILFTKVAIEFMKQHDMAHIDAFVKGEFQKDKPDMAVLAMSEETQRLFGAIQDAMPTVAEKEGSTTKENVGSRFLVKTIQIIISTQNASIASCDEALVSGINFDKKRDAFQGISRNGTDIPALIGEYVNKGKSKSHHKEASLLLETLKDDKLTSVMKLKYLEATLKQYRAQHSGEKKFGDFAQRLAYAIPAYSNDINIQATRRGQLLGDSANSWFIKNCQDLPLQSETLSSDETAADKVGAASASESPELRKRVSEALKKKFEGVTISGKRMAMANACRTAVNSGHDLTDAQIDRYADLVKADFDRSGAKKQYNTVLDSITQSSSLSATDTHDVEPDQPSV